MTGKLSVEDASTIIGLVYESALEKNQWQSLMEYLRNNCPGHVAAVATFEDAKWVSSHAPTLPVDEQGEQIEKLMDDVEDGSVRQPNDLNDTLFGRQPLELGTLYSTRKVFSEEEFRSFEGYKQTMQPIGAGHWTGTHFSISGEKRAAIIVVENDFDPTEKDFKKVEEIITLIAPHAVRAARFARTLTLAREAAETYSGFVDAIALPLIILTKDGSLHVANTLGQRLLDAGDIINIGNGGRVALPSRIDTDSLYRCIAQADSDGGPHAFLFAAEDDNFAACVCPYQPALSLASDIDKRLFSGQNLFAVFVGARPSGEINTRLLRDAFGLTTREAEVCRSLLSGKSPTEIAAEMDKAQKTIRNQIHAVHDKVGVNNTVDLIEALTVFRTVGAMYQDS